MLNTAAQVSDTTTRHYRLSRTEYDRAIEAGVFEPEARLELVDGDLLAMTPQGSRHATGVDLVADSLGHAFGAGFHVRMQLPLAIDDYSEPEPDVAVVTGNIRDYRNAHPTAALLVVEVSDDSLRRDQTVKQRLYARCGIPEYWILSLPDNHLEVYRGPTADGYRTVSVHRAGETVAPLARSEARVAIEDLLP